MKTASQAISNEELRKQKSFLGHPKGVGTLSFMQLCNSYASYGMSAILIYYLYAVKPEGLGLSQANAAQLISLYSACSLMFGIVGSYVADRILGTRRALCFSRAVTVLAYVCLALPFGGIVGYVGAMCLLLVSAMLCGRSADALMGKFYDKSDSRRDGAYTIGYVISNIGAAAPVISGAIALATGYHAAFLVCAVFAALGVAAYLITEKKFFGTIGYEPDDPLPADKKKSFIVKMIAAIVVTIAVFAVLFISGILTIGVFSNVISTAAIFIPIIYFVIIITSPKTQKEEKTRVANLIPAFICNCFAMLVWTQSTSILAIFTEQRVDRVIFGMEISAASFQTLPAVFAIFLGAVVGSLWSVLGKRQPLAPAKIGIGTILWGCGPLFMTLPFMLYGAADKVSPLWIVVFYLLIILGEAFTSPVGYSCASIVAPQAFATQMITVWSMSQSTGAALNTLAVNFYKEGSEVPFFLVIGLITCAAGLIVLIFGKKIAAGMGMLEKTE